MSRRPFSNRRPDTRRAAEPAEVRSAAMRLLARRDFAAAELRERLEKKGFEASAVTATVAELIEERALDDARYVGNYVVYHADRGEGPVKIAAELRAMSLPAELVDRALEAITDWALRARAVRSRRFGPEAPSDWPEKARQARFLQYRGFSSDHIRSALGADFDLD